jgi:arylsulfatase A-like enzyme
MTDGARADFMLDARLTPNTHNFLRKHGGVKFTNCYSTSTWTLPAQMSLFTGLLPVNHGLNDITYCNRRQIIKVIDENYFSAKNVEDEQFLVGKMKERGYDTKIFSNYITYQFLANNHHKMFDETILWDFMYHQHEKVTKAEIRKPFFWFIYDDDGGHAPYGVFKRDKRKDFDEHKKSGKYVNDSIARKNPMKWTENALKKKVRNQMHQYDTNKLSKFWKWFEENKLYEDTMVFIMSDHGEEYWEHEWVGHVANCYEGIVKIPLLMYHPIFDVFEADDTMHSIVDIPATILGESQFGEGWNLHVRETSRVVFFEFLRKAKPWERRREFTPENLDIKGLRWRQWKYLLTKKLDGRFIEELYDIDKDPREEDNLLVKTDYLGTANKLRGVLKEKYHDIQKTIKRR